ncbi:hypothetical protein LX16_3437 [Stackebrandtia albiflava]|uniref:Uncharacterized protein n=1 Tax=Stackebrandtia albiflava TaxID=406432 RepID=A0A562V499_9ACTN|nr:hypothetical protein [Stackebrandtia albiflava]TWJ12675.1 hypothetical protein LX16_3437 [Stackebrandtia albiflava]
MSEFPGNLESAITSLVNTLVNKMIQAEEDSDSLEEFQRLMAEAGFPGGVNDVNIRNYANQKAEEIWGPFKELPQVSSFDAPIDAIKGAKDRITNTGVTDLESAENFSINALIPGYMESFETNQRGWRGYTVDAIRSDYLNRWGGMTFLQANTLALLQILLEAYRRQVEEAQKDVVRLVTAAEEVIASFDPGSLCGGADSRADKFNIAIGVATVVSAAAGVASFGTTSIAAAMAVGMTGWGKDKFAYEEKSNEFNIDGDSVTAIWQSIITSTEELRKEYEDSEAQLADMATEFYNGIEGGTVRTGKDAYGGKVEIAATTLITCGPLPSTGDVDRPLNGADNPDPAHTPDRTPN